MTTEPEFELPQDGDPLAAAAEGPAPDAPAALALCAALAQPGREHEALAAEVGAAAAAAFLADPHQRAEVEALRALFAAVRTGPAGASHGGTASAAAARRVTRRVLARTTRLDSGWRGDLRLVLDFAAERLRASTLLRVAAALLLVQLTVVPLVAWHLWRAPQPEGFQVRIERRAAATAPGQEQEQAEEYEAIAVLADAALPTLASEEHGSELRALGRAVLAAAAGPQDDPSVADMPPVGGVEGLLRERALALAGDLPEGWVPSAPTTPLERLIALDLALDRRLVLGHARELGALLDGCAAELAAAVAGDYADALRQRAAALHLVPGAARGAGGELGRPVPGAAEARALRAALHAEGAAAGPWARAWLAVLDGR